MSDADTFPDPDQLLRDPLLRSAPEVEGFKVLDPAILFARLGRGGMGAVYRGLHCKFNIDVAVKCLMPSLAAEDPSFVARFQREASLAARLNHENIVRVMEVRRHGDLHYLVMEFVRGETVRERVRRKGPLAEREALTILRGACAGLAEAHAQQERIVHRDIKPDNVLISVDGKVKVADLGLARSESPIDSLTLSGSSAGSMGTPQYMPPEQWKTPKVGPTADVWALGATLYFVLTGVDAFSAGSLFELGKAICEGEFPDVRALRPDVADGVVALLKKAVRKEPGERFADAGAMLAALQPLLGGEEAKMGDPEGFARMQGAATVTPPPRETILRIRAKLEEPVDTIPGGPPGARTQGVQGPLGARVDAATARSVDPEAATRPQGVEPAMVPSPVRTGEVIDGAPPAAPVEQIPVHPAPLAPPPIVPSAQGRAEPAARPAPAAELALAFAAPMPRRTIFWLATAAAVLAAVWQTWALRWTCDDAYISFRYAQHFAEGHGLVYNLDPQEAPVEGYTNFSWTMFLALGHVLGFAGDGLETWSIAGGILCHAGTVLLLALMAWRASGGRAVLPLAACGYAAIHHAASLAPAGLETALFVLVATAMLRLCLALRCAREAWLLGFLGVLAATTRPDGALLCAIAGGFVLFDAVRRKAPRLVLVYAAPFVLVFLPYLLWRYAYYGYWVPNTFYAKSGGDPFVEQGFVYLRDFFLCYWPLLAAFVPLPIYLAKKPDLLASISPFLGRRPWLAVAAFVLPYLGFVAWVGGDFMFGRFVLPVLPALLFGLDLLCLRWRAPWLPPALAVWLVVGLQVRFEPADLGDFTARVSDNRRISVVPYGDTTLIEAFRLIGHALAKEFDGLAVRIGIGGAQANLAYRAKVPVAIECASGLTDAYIAHLPAPARGKAGHEKGPWLYPGYLERRGVHFMFEGAWEKDDAWREVKFFNTVPARLVRYEPQMIAELRRRDPGFVCVDFERLLDDYLATIADQPKEQVASDLAKFRRVWFDHQDDPVRLAKFTARLAQ